MCFYISIYNFVALYDQYLLHYLFNFHVINHIV